MIKGVSYQFTQTGEQIQEILNKVGTLPTSEQLSEMLHEKQDVIDDLAEIRSGAAKGSTALQAAIPLRWDDLRELMYGEDGVVPGQWYRITDYVTKVNVANAQSAEWPYDILVLATSDHDLSEVAYATAHDDSTYIRWPDIDAWELRYNWSNDEHRFPWIYGVAAKGVVYWMRDGFGNEAPYDFKNIKFRRWPVASTTRAEYGGLVGKDVFLKYGPTMQNSFPSDCTEGGTEKWLFTFDDGYGGDASCGGRDVRGNVIEACYDKLFDVGKRILNDVVFLCGADASHTVADNRVDGCRMTFGAVSYSTVRDGDCVIGLGRGEYNSCSNAVNLADGNRLIGCNEVTCTGGDNTVERGSDSVVNGQKNLVRDVFHVNINGNRNTIETVDGTDVTGDMNTVSCVQPMGDATGLVSVEQDMLTFPRYKMGYSFNEETWVLTLHGLLVGNRDQSGLVVTVTAWNGEEWTETWSHTYDVKAGATTQIHFDCDLSAYRDEWPAFKVHFTWGSSTVDDWYNL